MNRRSFVQFLKVLAVVVAVVVLLVAGVFFRLAEYEAGVRPAQYPGDPNAYRFKD